MLLHHAREGCGYLLVRGPGAAVSRGTGVAGGAGCLCCVGALPGGGFATPSSARLGKARRHPTATTLHAARRLAKEMRKILTKQLRRERH